MAKYRITGPDGKKYDVTAPDDADQEQVLQYFKDNYRSPGDVRTPAETPPEPAGERSLAGDVGHHAGLTLRNVFNGVLGLPALGVDVISAGANDVVRLYNKATGKTVDLPFPKGAMQNLNDRWTEAGLPTPENAQQRIAGRMQSALVGGATTMGAGAAMQPAGPVGAAVQEALTAAPGTQTAANLGGSAASGVAAEMGAGPTGQAIAGITGGILAPAAMTVGAGAARAVGGAIAPFTKGGREEIVGGALNQLASDPARARFNLANNAVELVPDSLPTTAQAAKDYGLAKTERGLRTQSQQGQFAARDAANNTARTVMLDSIAKDKAAITAAVAEREAQTAPLRDAAFAQATPVDPQPIIRAIDTALESPAGARETTAGALNWLKGKLTKETGRTTTFKLNGQTFQSSPTMRNLVGAGNTIDPRRLYAIRQDINDVLEGRLAGSQAANLKLASKELIAARNVIDQQLEAAAPGFKDYLKTYRDLSKPINQMETLQDIAVRTTNAGTDIHGNQIVSQAKWYNVVTKNRDELAQVLTPDQMKTLTRIGKDLDRGTFSITGNRVVGSNTPQDLSTANLLGAVLGGNVPSNPLVQSLMRPFQFVYRVPEAQMQELLIDAMLKPETAAALMGRATRQNVSTVARSIATGFRERAKAVAVPLTTQTMQPVAPVQNNQQ